MKVNSHYKVSIIIPVWSEPDSDGSLLRRVFDCCVNQTFKEIEIIAVNDKSPNQLDYDIMKEYKTKYPEIFVCLYLQENIRQGGARNRGLDIAKGDYVTFVDDDDTIDLAFCEKLYNAAVSSDADIAGCAWCHTGINQVYSQPLSFKAEGWVNFICSPWPKIVRREMLISNNLYFFDTPLMEDIATYFWAVYSKKTVFVDEALYYWNMRDDSWSLGGQIWSISSFGSFIEPYNAYLAKMEFIRNTKAYSYCALYILRHIILYSRRLYTSGDIMKREEIYRSFHKLINKIDIKRMTSSVRNQYSDSFDKLAILVKEKNVEECLMQFEKWLDNMLQAFKSHAYTPSIQVLYRYLQSISQSTICLWGSGKNGSAFSQILSESGIKHEVTDINPETYQKKMPSGIKVKPWDEIKNYIKTVLVCTSAHYNDIVNTIGYEYLIIDLHQYLLSELPPERYLENSTKLHIK